MRFLTTRHGILALFCLSAAVRADVYHRQLLPLGEREAYLANAGAGDAADAGAVYYNPAGLALVNGAKISITASTYGYYDLKWDNLLYFNDGPVSYEASGFVAIPSTAVGVWQFGDWRVAFSTLIPETLTVENRQRFTTPTYDGNIVQSTNSQELWLGLSAARSWGPWSAGLTLWGMQHGETTVLSILAGQSADQTKIFDVTERKALTAYSLSATLGLRYQLNPDWSFGLRVQTPTLPISGKADYFSAAHISIFGPVISQVNDAPGIRGVYFLPIDMTLAAAWKPGAGFSILLDVSGQGATHYNSMPDLGKQENAIDTHTELRASLGVEYEWSKRFSLKSGFFVNPDANANHDQGGGKSVSDYYGVTLGASYLAGQIQSGVGVFYDWSSGAYYTGGTTSASPYHTQVFGALLSTAYLF